MPNVTLFSDDYLLGKLRISNGKSLDWEKELFGLSNLKINDSKVTERDLIFFSLKITSK